MDLNNNGWKAYPQRTGDFWGVNAERESSIGQTAEICSTVTFENIIQQNLLDKISWDLLPGLA
jgi:hypothetical protein